MLSTEPGAGQSYRGSDLVQDCFSELSVMTRADLSANGSQTWFYEDAASLFVRAYDAFYDREPPQIAGDVPFYQRLARELAGLCSNSVDIGYDKVEVQNDKAGWQPRRSYVQARG